MVLHWFEEPQLTDLCKKMRRCPVPAQLQLKVCMGSRLEKGSTFLNY